MEISTIGLDLAKSVFKGYGVDAARNVVLRRKLRRGEVPIFFSRLSPCLVGTEACTSSHHWTSLCDISAIRRISSYV
jgi:transposase